MHSIDNLAAYILNKYKSEITPMKLQKLLYYIKVWILIDGKGILDTTWKFEAWKHGPVNPFIYHKFKGYKNNPIQNVPEYQPPNKEELEIIDFILESYAFYNAITLSKATHAEDPWINKKDYNGTITDEEICNYYSKELFAKNFPLNFNQCYYPPNTLAHYAYTFDMAKDDKASEYIFDSIEEYKSLFIEVKNHTKSFYRDSLG